MRLAALLGVPAVPAFGADAGWGKDINAGAGPELVESVRADLVAIVKASEAKRVPLIEAFAESPKASAAIEAVKRFRNPELRGLFLALSASEDWKLRHRALTALDQYPGAFSETHSYGYRGVPAGSAD